MTYRLKKILRKTFLAVSFILCTSRLLATGPFINPDKAFSEAARLQRAVLLIFSGSDWCVQCIQFQKKVLDDSGFQHFAADNLILLEADFSQRKRLPDSLAAAYDALAAKYNSDGTFPKMLLLATDGNVIAEMPWQHGSAFDFTLQLQLQIIKHHHHW